MWPESSPVKAVNLLQKSIKVTAIMNFSKGIVFYWRTLYIPNGISISSAVLDSLRLCPTYRYSFSALVPARSLQHVFTYLMSFLSLIKLVHHSTERMLYLQMLHIACQSALFSVARPSASPATHLGSTPTSKLMCVSGYVLTLAKSPWRSNLPSY